MDRLTENKIVLVVRHTRLDDLIARFNTRDQARFYLERLGADFSDYELEDQTYKEARRQAERRLSRLGRLQVLDRAFVPNFLFGPDDTVVALGQDGLVANVLKYLDGQPTIGVNPDPQRWEGVLLPFTVNQLDRLLPEVFARRRPLAAVTMAQADLNTGQTLFAVNDLFIGPKSHASARYHIRSGDRAENHSSSGVIVSTGLGATGWMRSILAGATGIAAALCGAGFQPASSGPSPGLQPASSNPGPPKPPGFGAWDADYLYFSVREPWPSKTSQANITFGQITAASPLFLQSRMPENGVIFSDGIEADFLSFNSGALATITVAGKKGRLVK